MNEAFQELSETELQKILLEEIKRFNQKLEEGRPFGELKEKRRNIRRIYMLLADYEKVELTDIFGDGFLQILL